MPDRIIRESALISPTLEKLSAEAERLFWRLTLVADDYGRFDADPRVVVARALPLFSQRIALKDAAVWLAELIEAGLVVVYQVGERIFAAFKSWSKYQRHRESRPKFPPPNEGTPIDAALFAATCGNSRQLAARARAIEGREPRDESREPGVESRTPDPPAADLPPPRARPPRGSSRSAVSKVPTSGEDRAPSRVPARQGNGEPEHIGPELRGFMAKVRAVAHSHEEV
jgi:hypothetical protein